MAEKLTWEGRVLGVQPRIRLLRSFDETAHTYLGYNLRLDGRLGDARRTFVVAVGKAAHQKHEFGVGDSCRGQGVPVEDPRREAADLYRVSGIKVERRGAAGDESGPPPFTNLSPTLDVYRGRGHRRLSVSTYRAKCAACIWGCVMPVEIIVDNWNPDKARRHRRESFCYGPKSCPSYRAGPARKVTGRHGEVYVEEDWVDEDRTAHRGPDE